MRNVASSGSCASRGRHQNDRKAIVRSSACIIEVETARNERRLRTFNVFTRYRRPTPCSDTGRYSRVHFARLSKSCNGDGERRRWGRAALEDGGTSRCCAKSDPPLEDLEFRRSRDNLSIGTCASRRRLASTRDARTTLRRTYLRSYVRS